MYNPQRDLAYVGRGMLKQACVALDEEWWEPWFTDYMEYYGLTYDDLGPAAIQLAEALNQVIGAKDPGVALEESGFSDLPAPLQCAFYIRMGQVLLAGIWSGIKDVSAPDDAPPADLKDILDEAERAVDSLLGRRRNESRETT